MCMHVYVYTCICVYIYIYVYDYATLSSTRPSFVFPSASAHEQLYNG